MQIIAIEVTFSLQSALLWDLSHGCTVSLIRFSVEHHRDCWDSVYF